MLTSAHLGSLRQQLAAFLLQQVDNDHDIDWAKACGLGGDSLFSACSPRFRVPLTSNRQDAGPPREEKLQLMSLGACDSHMRSFLQPGAAALRRFAGYGELANIAIKSLGQGFAFLRGGSESI